MLDLFYGLPFILISLVAFGACIAVRPWRKNALHGLVLPVTFGASSIIGAFCLGMIAETLLERLQIFSMDTNKIVTIVLFAAGYFLSGTSSAWMAFKIVRWLQSRPLPVNPPEALQEATE